MSSTLSAGGPHPECFLGSSQSPPSQRHCCHRRQNRGWGTPGPHQRPQLPRAHSAERRPVRIDEVRRPGPRGGSFSFPVGRVLGYSARTTAADESQMWTQEGPGGVHTVVTHA